MSDFSSGGAKATVPDSTPRDQIDVPELRVTGGTYVLLDFAVVALALAMVSVVGMALSLSLPVPPVALLVVSSAVAIVLSGIILRSAARPGDDVLPIAALATAAVVMLLFSLYHLAGYIRLPVDLLSFSESPFVTDILKLQSGHPLYTPAEDNNSYPYTPGTQILTYAIASAWGYGSDIAALRTIQFGYVILAAGFAAGTCHLLARLLVGSRYRHRPVWVAAWFCLLLLAATAPRFNAYTHSLHNDGLALLVSMVAYWLMARWAVQPRTWVLAAMAVLPAAGFLVKQNQLLWAGIFALYLFATGGLRITRLLAFIAATTTFVVGAVLMCYVLWGESFIYWIFAALGDKEVSVARSGRHLLMAGSYVAMALAAFWVFVLRERSRAAAALLGAWALAFGLQTYTSGIGFAANHMGPAIVLAVCWMLVTLVMLWPQQRGTADRWISLQASAAAGMVVMLFGGLGLVREPVSPVPPDFLRYVAEIEAEFADLPVESVLLDTGTWPYLEAGVLMRDRAIPVSLHVGINQAEIGREKLNDTIRRFREQRYARILAREIDTDQSRYDFQNRGSGVREAILDNYREVRRIRAVEGVDVWWPIHLLSEIVVLEPEPRVETGLVRD